MTYLITFLEGIFSFLSPCMLPLLPVYLTYFAGNADKKGGALPRTLAFVAGFTLSFLVLGLPIFDTIFAIIRRWVNGYPIMRADKGHIHHRIMATGMGQRRTVLIMYCISAIMGTIAILVVQRMMLEALLLSLVAGVLVCVFIADHATVGEIFREGIPPEEIGMLNRKHKEHSGKRASAAAKPEEQEKKQS